jgi:peptidoglycan/LPS O-acetylase OafA/YrhL
MNTFRSVSSVKLSERGAIHFLRALAIVFILLCHLFEAYDNSWSAFFYLGVPVFFIISGYLYGHKNIRSWRSFALRRLLRIYIPYLFFIIPALTIYFLFRPQIISPAGSLIYLFNLQGFTGCTLGLNHLWFVTAIAACYASLPLLQYGRCWRQPACLLCWLLLVLDFLLLDGRFYWLPLFGISYYSATATVKEVYISLFAALVICLFQVFIWNKPYFFTAAAQCNLVRSLGAFFLVNITILWFNKKRISTVHPIIIAISFCSYPLYLVHNLLFVGPFSWNHLTTFIPFNIFLMLFVSILLSVALQAVSQRTTRLFSKNSDPS